VGSQQAVGNAIDAALSQPGIHLRMSISGVNQLKHEGKGLTPQAATGPSRAAIVINVYPGHGESISSAQFAKDTDNQFDFALQAGNTVPVEIRDLAGVLYARADLGTLQSQFGGDPSTIQQFQTELNKANTFVPGLSNLASGRWVSADLRSLSTVLPQASSAPQAIAASVVNDLRSAFNSNSKSTVVRQQGGRTEYQVTVQARSLVQALLGKLPGDISNAAGNVPLPGAGNLSGEVTNALKQALSQMPANQKIVADVWVKGNTAQEIDANLNQFDNPSGSPVPLQILLGPGTDVGPPAHAAPLDFSRISGLLGGLMGGGRAAA
jgi:hypothetical protein